MLAGAILTVLVALIALDQTLRLAWLDRGPWRRALMVAGGIALAAGAAFG